MKRGLMHCWTAVYEDAIKHAFKRIGVNLDSFTCGSFDYNNDENIFTAVENYLIQCQSTNIPCDFVFSVNYIPVLSKVCEKHGVKYISWSMDSPLSTLYSKTISNECNYFFTFDRVQLNEAVCLGAKHVYSMPCGSGAMTCGESQGYMYDISFLGNLYNNGRDDMYSTINTLPDRLKGFYEGIMQAQMQVYGYNFIQELINADMWNETRKCVTINGDAEYVDAYENHFVEMLNRHISRMERKKVLEEVGNRWQVDLYTGSDISELDTKGIINHGYADYFKDMPKIFAGSKINLNITSKSIISGIPLRVFDIMSCGGFVLSNYQPELAELFENGREVVMYDSIPDLLNKIEYYLAHDDEREEIAHNGYLKVKEHYTFEKCLEKILDTVFGEVN